MKVWLKVGILGPHEVHRCFCLQWTAKLISLCSPLGADSCDLIDFHEFLAGTRYYGFYTWRLNGWKRRFLSLNRRVLSLREVRVKTHLFLNMTFVRPNTFDRAESRHSRNSSDFGGRDYSRIRNPRLNAGCAGETTNQCSRLISIHDDSILCTLHDFCEGEIEISLVLTTYLGIFQ